MGKDLHSKSGDWWYWTNIAWDKILSLAQTYGWESAGTEQPPYSLSSCWEGQYITNDGQLVTAVDAKAIGNALENALDDIPDHSEMPEKLVTFGSEERTGEPITDAFLHLFGEGVVGPNYALNAYEFFGGDDKRRFIDFIAFCRRGGFYIW